MDSTISIIIPVYNSSKYISYCIDSIIECNGKDVFEIILIDDGSTDGSLEVCQKYAKKSDNIKVVHRKNCGVSATRNYGIRAAKGKWIWFVDSDDVLYPGAVDILWKEVNKNNADITIFGYQEFINNIEFHNLKKNSDRSISKQQAIGTLLNQKYASYPWNKIFKKSMLIDNAITFPENIKMCEDIIFSYKAYDKADSFVIINNDLYGYRRGGGGISLSNEKWKYKDIAMVMLEFFNYIEASYPQGSSQVFRETIMSVVAYLHRYDRTDDEYMVMRKFVLSHKKQWKNLSMRYKIEVATFAYNKLVFDFIGLIEKKIR